MKRSIDVVADGGPGASSLVVARDTRRAGLSVGLWASGLLSAMSLIVAAGHPTIRSVSAEPMGSYEGARRWHSRPPGVVVAPCGNTAWRAAITGSW